MLLSRPSAIYASTMSGMMIPDGQVVCLRGTAGVGDGSGAKPYLRAAVAYHA